MSCSDQLLPAGIDTGDGLELLGTHSNLAVKAFVSFIIADIAVLVLWNPAGFFPWLLFMC